MKKLLQNKKVLIAVCVVLIAALAVGAYFIFRPKEEGKKLIMGIDAEYPPFSYRGENGEFTGFDVEVCRAVSEKLGYKLEIFPVNWDQKLVQLNSKECDLIWSGMTILPSMTEQGYLISRPYFDNTQVLVVKADSGIASSADLVGKAVAVQLGTSGQALLKGDQKELADTFSDIVTCDSFLKCFTELEGNAVDAVFVDQPVAKSYVAKHPALTILDENLGAEQYGIAFRGSDQELMKAVEGALDELIRDGSYAAIAEKYPDVKNGLLLLEGAN